MVTFFMKSLDPNAGRRTYVELSDISPYLLATTIATEDKEFYNHPGFNPIAIARALVQNVISGGEGTRALQRLHSNWREIYCSRLLNEQKEHIEEKQER